MITISKLKIASDNSKINIAIRFPEVYGKKKATVDESVFIIKDDNNDYDSISVIYDSTPVSDTIVINNRNIEIRTTSYALSHIVSLIAQEMTLCNILSIDDYTRTIVQDVIDAPFERKNCYADMDIDYVFFANHNTYDKNWILPTNIDPAFLAECIDKKIGYYELTAADKAAIKSEAGLDIAMSKNMDIDFENNLMFVYVHTSDTPSAECEDIQCEKCYSIGSTYNAFDFYTMMLDASYRIKKGCCQTSEGFSDYVLQSSRLNIALSLGIAEDAIDAWKIIHKENLGFKSLNASSKCSCNG